MQNVIATEKNDIVTIKFNGLFKFDIYKDLKKAYDPFLNKKDIKFVLDFKQVDIIDSSGLGMLLVLREELVSRHKIKPFINIVNAKPETLKIFEITNFDLLFRFDK